MTQRKELQEYIYGLAISSDGRCFSAKTSGLYHSIDGAQTWHNALEALDLPEPVAVTAVDIAPNQQTVFASVAGAILRSEDEGLLWHMAALPAPAPIISALAVSPNFMNDNTVFAASLDDGIFVSQDRGTSWTDWNFGLIGFEVNALAVSPDYQHNATLFAGTELGVFCTKNGGRSWEIVCLFPDPINTLALSHQPQSLWVGTAYHLYHLNTAHDSMTSVLNGDIGAVINLSDRNRVVALCSSDIWVAMDGGNHWEKRTSEAAIVSIAMNESSPGTLLAGYIDGTVRLLTL